MGRRLLALAFAVSLAFAAGASPPPAEVDAFYVSKSENRNQVHYALRLSTTTCAPDGAAPVRPFWRMFEKGSRVVEGLLGREEPAYGLASQAVVARGESGGAVRVTLRAMPDRPILLVTSRAGDVCRVMATTTINGAAARLERVHVQLAWPFGVAHLELVGARLVDARPVSERVHP